MSQSEIDREQEYLDTLYARLDAQRRETAYQAEAVLREQTGTAQARLEREAASTRHSERLARLDAAENRLYFGRLDLRDGTRHHIGRIGLSAMPPATGTGTGTGTGTDIATDADPLLIDWRAPAARPFYVATPVAPQGVTRRRHISTRDRTVLRVDDELFGESPGGRADLAGEAALLATLDTARTGRMHDIVATLQAEQDRIIRSEHRGVLVVQGGPGTGKTAVALHRAAYLLYTHRQLASRGVLVVGPSAVFLGYIGQVLPGLGETNVLLSTVGELFPHVTAARTEPPETAELKGRAVLAEVVAAAVRDRQAPPHAPVTVEAAGEVLRLDSATLRHAAARATAGSLPHNQARRVFHEHLIAHLAERLAGRTRRLADLLDAEVADVLAEADVAKGIEADLAGLEGLGIGGDAAPAHSAHGAHDVLEEETDQEELRRRLRADPAVRSVLGPLWPALTPQRLLEELFADPGRIASAAPDLTEAERARLLRAPGGGWTAADVPLLDEAAELLGTDERAAARQAARERRERVAYAQGVLDTTAGPAEGGAALAAADLLSAEQLARRHEVTTHRTVTERAASDRTWAFGHVIVDEAQELSPMAWRLLMRRCPTRSMTVVGDVAQTGDAAGATSWAQALAPHVGDRWRLSQLTVNYRTPAEIMAAADGVLRAMAPGTRPPRSVRTTGVPPWRRATTGAGLPGALAESAAHEAAAPGTGRVAVIVPRGRLDELAAAVARAVPQAASGPCPDLESRVVVLTVGQAKGLEFDSVLIGDPGGILRESPRGLNDLYVALTRATQRLGILHPGPPPAALSDTVALCSHGPPPVRDTLFA